MVGRGPLPLHCLSAAVDRFVPSALLLPARISSTRHYAALAWCAPVEVPRICCGIRWRRPCCDMVHRSRTSLSSCATAPLRLRRSTPKSISRLYGKLHNPGRRCSHVDPRCRDLSGGSQGRWFRVAVRRFSLEKLCCVLRSEKRSEERRVGNE